MRACNRKLEYRTREHLIHHDFEKALVSAEQSLRLSKTPEAVSQKAAALFEMRRFKDYIEFVNLQFRDTTIGYALLGVSSSTWRCILGVGFPCASEDKSTR